MRVFLAGASGAIGSRLVPQLRERGHEVTGSTRSPDRADEIREAGAEAVICDAFDAEGLKRAVMGAMPDVVVNELTSLPRDYDPRKLDESFYAPTNRVRTEGGGNLLDAARASTAKRFVTQSIAFLYAREGPMVADEEARPATDAPPRHLAPGEVTLDLPGNLPQTAGDLSLGNQDALDLFLPVRRNAAG